MEVSPHASELVIKAARSCLAQTNHPDKNSGSSGASELQARINHAYSVLSDPVKRRRYDEATELHERFIERRGNEIAAPARTKAAATEHQGLRAFAFRPFT